MKWDIMAALKFELYEQSAPSETFLFLNPKQKQMYQEILSFDGGVGFASEDEIIVKKTDGTMFRSSIHHYESDFMTETYVGHFPNGERFRFLFASQSNPMALIDPMVTFASMSTSGWAIHFRVRP